MIKISHKLLLGDFDSFDEVMPEKITGSKFVFGFSSSFVLCSSLDSIYQLNI